MTKYRFKWLMLLAMCLAVFVLCLILNYNLGQTDVRYCFMNGLSALSPLSSQHQQQQQQQQQSHQAGADGRPQLLEDVLLGEPKPSAAGQSIFFHETSCHQQEHKSSLFGHYPVSAPLNLVQLTAREACAIESAARHNPNFSIFVLFASPAYRDNTTSPLLEAILSYSNVHLRNLNLWTYAAGTPLYDWLKDGALFKSSYVLSHISDFLRYVTLWRWGGTYLDMDVVVLRSLEQLPPNYAGAESDTHLAAGVMNFASDGFGHEVAEKCLHDFQRNFNGNDWGNNGPGVITRVMHAVCQTRNIALMFNHKRCMGFHVMSREAFYAIPWKQWEHFFEAQYLADTLERIKHSYVAHVWNKHSKQRRIKVGTNAAYGKLATQHCPKVYAAAGEYF